MRIMPMIPRWDLGLDDMVEENLGSLLKRESHLWDDQDLVTKSKWWFMFGLFKPKPLYKRMIRVARTSSLFNMHIYHGHTYIMTYV